MPATIWEMEEAMIECHELERRYPGEARRIFASDGPWHLIRAEAGDYGGQGTDGASRDTAPRTPLRTAEYERWREVLGWLQQVGDIQNRKLVWLASRQLAKGEPGVPWQAISDWLDWKRTARALDWRYRMGLAEMVCGAARLPRREARVLASAARPAEADDLDAGWR